MKSRRSKSERETRSRGKRSEAESDDELQFKYSLAAFFVALLSRGALPKISSADGWQRQYRPFARIYSME